MILLVALLLGVAALMVVLGATLGELGWLYGAIAGTVSALVLLAIAVVRRRRRPPVTGAADTGETHPDPDDPDPDAGPDAAPSR